MNHLRVVEEEVIYPYFDWSSDFPTISFPYPREGLDFPEQDIYWVESKMPEEIPPEGYHYEEGKPVLKDGKWEGVWELVKDSESPGEDFYNRYVGNEKLDLFTFEEQLAVVEATLTDPMVKLTYDRMLGASYFSYEDPQTKQGLDLLVTKGLLTEERMIEIVKTVTNGHIDLSQE